MNLQEHWNKKQLPDVGDICFSTGRVINFFDDMCLTSFDYSERQMDDFGTVGNEVEIYECITSSSGLLIYRGAGEMGNTGFLSCTDESGVIIWSLLLDFSNPFISFNISHNIIVARTEIDYEFKIPIVRPEEMTCKSYNAWNY